ncbi:MAG: TraB/GumN family protein [Chromatiaceae bacterium]|jgi:hypothetical protein|nr:TraB/GumN family protein [Chromatiaceae bacterium]
MRLWGRVVASLLVVLLWAGSAPAGEGAFSRGLLFEVQAEGGGSCWLFGTIHSEDPRVLDLPAPVRHAFDSADTLILEVVPDAQAILESMVTMVYTDGRGLESALGPELYREAVAAVADLGMSEAAIRDFKPWALITVLSVPPGATGEFLDLRLHRLAVSASKPVRGLETINEQLAVFEDLSEADQVSLLRETLAVRDQLPAIFERLLTAYLARDLGGLKDLSDEYLEGGDPDLARRFHAAAVDVRNARMAERVAPMIAGGDCFVAVGALHLPGEGGILARLAGQGFAIRVAY